MVNIKNNDPENEKILSEEWNNIDIEPLKEIGFTRAHLIELAMRNKLSPQEVQASIYYFAFDIKENNKLKWSLEDFSSCESLQDKSMYAYLKRKEKIEEQRIIMENKVFEFEFEEWYSFLSEKEIKEILIPFNVKYTDKESPFVVGAAKAQFNNKIWEGVLYKINKKFYDDLRAQKTIIRKK